MSVRNLDQLVFGSGDDDSNSLVARIRTAWELAKAPATKEKVGKECDLVSVVCAIEGKDSRQIINREVKVSESPDSVASWLRKELELDPGPAFNGTLRFYFRIFGASENGKLGSYQREVRSTELPTDTGASIAQVQSAILMPMFDRMVAMHDASTRMLAGHALVIEQMGKATAVVVDILKGNRTVEPSNPIVQFLGQALSAAGAAGAPGAGAAGKALTTLARPGGMPSLVPSLSERTGFTKSSAPEFGLTTPTSGTSPASSTSASAKPGALTRDDVEKWADEHPDEAKAMIAAAARRRGAPDAIIQMITG